MKSNKKLSEAYSFEVEHSKLYKPIFCNFEVVKKNIICCLSRKVSFGQNSEIPILYFCASMKLCTQPAKHVNCLKVFHSS